MSDGVKIEDFSFLIPGELFKIDVERCEFWNVKNIRYRLDRLNTRNFKTFKVGEDDPVLLLLEIEIQKINKFVNVDHLVFYYDNQKYYVDTCESVFFKKMDVVD